MRHLLLNTTQAAERLGRGEIIAYPTEAVYGLGCDPCNEAAVSKLLALKHRPVSAGLILIGSRLEQFSDWIGAVTPGLLETARASWPGPVTWLFPRSKDVPAWISGEHDSVAIRVTDHPVCIELCDAFGGPVVSTSANPHSAAPARSSVEVEEYFGAYLGGIVAGALGNRASTSEIRDLRTGKVLRA